MKKLSIASVGAAFLALGTVGTIGIAPAEAATWTKLDYQGDVNVNITFPILLDLSEEVNTSLLVDNLSGRLQDEGDSELTVDAPFNYLGYNFKELLEETGASLNSLSGSGSVSKEGNFLSAFNFFYDKLSDVLTVKDYNFDNIQVCLSSTCNLSGAGDFYGSILGFIPLSGNLNFNFDVTATPLGNSTPGGDNSAPGGDDSKSVPEPTTVFGLIGLGGLLATKRKFQKAV